MELQDKVSLEMGVDPIRASCRGSENQDKGQGSHPHHRPLQGSAILTYRARGQVTPKQIQEGLAFRVGGQSVNPISLHGPAHIYGEML